ncbi:hypothetical protein CYMTET_3910 [Cymbomonas tetramitiformis]|uniref:Hexosyltransferase n=1 Tax=Cymbomonas tetramitiformis TaxID=36881 RepID=A0AAE0H2B1_9CHLO|nr:hypothetical protein CYMTET_3910 [Cymbomonas tetramitiformis]
MISLTFFLVLVALGTANTILETLVFLYFHNDLHASNALCGLTVFFTIIFEYSIFQRAELLLRMCGPHLLLSLGTLAMVIRLLSYTFVSDPWYVLCVEPLHGIIFALTQMAAVHYVDTLAPPHLKTSAQNLRDVAKSVGGIIGAYGGGYCMTHFGSQVMFACLAAFVAVTMILHSLAVFSSRWTSNSIGDESSCLYKGLSSSRGSSEALLSKDERNPSTGGSSERCVTLITADSYLEGVVCLARSLANHGSKAPLLVLAADELLQKTLDVLRADPHCELISLNRKAGFEALGFSENEKSPNLLHQRYHDCWLKLLLWNMDSYSKLIFFDSDMVVLADVNEVFDLDFRDADVIVTAACLCSPKLRGKRPPTERWLPQNCWWSHQSRKSVCDLPEQHPGRYWNAGFMVLKPSTYLFQHLLKHLKNTDTSKFAYAEQDFLNSALKATFLPFGWNALKTLKFTHPDVWAKSRLRSIHYIFSKPWEQKEIWKSRVEGELKWDSDLETLDFWWNVCEQAN